MQRDVFSFSRKYGTNASVDKQRSEQYVYGEILDDTEPGEYA